MKTTPVNTPYTRTGYLVVHECGKCGVLFGMTEDYVADRKKDMAVWYCPNGHQRVFRESTAEKERRRAERAESEAAYFRDRMREEQQAAQHARNQVRAEKGAKTRLKKRIAAGVCPCCKRHFTNLERHIKGQHPEFVPANKASHGD